MADVVGIWRLIEARAYSGTGELLQPPYGPQPMGLVTFQADGRMMAVLCDGRPQLPAGSKREYTSYCGDYTFDGTTLVTRVDAAADPSRLVDQVRRVEFEGERLVLSVPPRSTGSGAEQRELVWERIA